MKQLTFVSLVVLLLIGCRKDTLQDRLEGDAANFVGKWEWTHSYEERGGGLEPPYLELYTPSTEGFTFQIEFLEEGIAIISKNEIELGRYHMDFSISRIAVADRVGIYGDMYRLVIGGERIDFFSHYYRYSQDTIQFGDLPYNLYGNYYKRIQ